MIIEVGSDNYRDIFGVRDFSAKFESRLPDYNVLQTALRDPSLKSDAIDQVLEATRSVGSLQAAGLADLQWGSQMLTYMRVTASKIGDSLTIPGNGMLTSMTESLVMTMREFKVPVEMDAEAIQAVLADAAFAAGLKGLGALGPIGKIAAAIIGTARAIVQVVRNVREAKDQTREHREQLLWLSMPPLQQPDTQVDSFYVDTVLRPIMETGSWTPVVSPRFGSDLWVGLPRNGGYAFAPGEEVLGENAFGEPNKVFTAGGGVGLIPGLDQITSVIQVSLDPQKLNGWNGSGRWPIRPEIVTDVGKFYINTGRLASIIWSWATAYDASPDLYKLDVGVHKGPGDQHLHYRWKRYCDAGLRFLRENAEDWYFNNKAKLLGDDKQFIFGSAIGCAIGAWRCFDTGPGGSYERVNPGRIREQMTGPALGRGGLGCVVDPPQMNALDQHGDPCMLTMYDVHIRGVLEKVRARQLHFLWHSLVAAYVKADFDAFRDPKMRDQLMRARKAMLEHPDRRLIELADVAEDEPGLPGSGKTWKEQLLASGVKPKHPLMHGGQRITAGPQPGTLKPDDDPPPEVPVSKWAMPFGELADKPMDEGESGAASSSRALWWLAGGAAVLGGGAALAYHLKKRRQK